MARSRRYSSSRSPTRIGSVRRIFVVIQDSRPSRKRIPHPFILFSPGGKTLSALSTNSFSFHRATHQTAGLPTDRAKPVQHEKSATPVVQQTGSFNRQQLAPAGSAKPCLYRGRVRPARPPGESQPAVPQPAKRPPARRGCSVRPPRWFWFTAHRPSHPANGTTWPDTAPGSKPPYR